MNPGGKLYAARLYQVLLLCCEVFCERLNRRLFTVRLLPLLSHEASLDQGRFAQFARLEQKHKVALAVRPTSGEALMAWVAQRVEWSAEHARSRDAHGAWSLRVRMASVHEGEIEFSFSDPATAVAFALLWSCPSESSSRSPT